MENYTCPKCGSELLVSSWDYEEYKSVTGKKKGYSISVVVGCKDLCFSSNLIASDVCVEKKDILEGRTFESLNDEEKVEYLERSKARVPKVTKQDMIDRAIRHSLRDIK